MIWLFWTEKYRNRWKQCTGELYKLWIWVWALVVNHTLGVNPKLSFVTFGNAAMRNLVVNCHCLTEPLKSSPCRMEALYCSLWLLLLPWFYSDLPQRSKPGKLFMSSISAVLYWMHTANPFNGMTGSRAKVFPDNDAWWFEAEDLARSYIVVLSLHLSRSGHR